MKPLADHETRQRVLTDFERNLVVTAGAGTGKTSLLVGRLAAALLLQHLEPANVVALTFTENATSEMRARLVRLLRAVPAFVAGTDLDTIAESDRAVLERLALDASMAQRSLEILAIADRLQIATFHGFCLRLLQRHARTLGLPSRLTLVEPAAARLAFDEDFEAWLALRSRDELRPALATATATRLREIAWQVAGLPEDTVLACPEPPDFAVLRTEIGKLRAAFPKALAKYRGFLLELEEVCSARLEGKTPKVADRTPYLKADKVPRPGKSQIKDAVIEAELIEKAAHWATTLAPWALGDDATVATALAFVQPFVAEQRARRQRSGTLSFDDLVLTVRHALMTKPAVRTAIAGEIRTLLVDEFQDTDPLQYEIVFLLAADPEIRGTVRAPLSLRLRAGVLCIVGDVKQSIYRFRRADVAAYARTVDAILAQGGARLVLAANFRSRPPILAFTNRVCTTTLRHDPPWQQGYEDVLATREPHEAARVELHALRLPDGTSAEERRTAEGRHVVATLQRLIAEGRRPREIAVLLRAAADTNWLVRPLRESGIAYSFRGGRRFYLRHEIVVASALLRAIACPHDAVAVLAVLRSALSGATDLAITEHVERHHSVDYLVPCGNGKVAQALTLLRELRDEVVLLPLDRAVRRLLIGPEMIAAEACGYEGAQRLANLQRLCSRIQDEQPLDLVDAAAMLERHTQRDTQDEESPLFDEDQDAVRIMTVHASKGLEFGVVIVPDVGRALETSDRSDEQVRVERWSDAAVPGAFAVHVGDVRNTLGWVAKAASERHAEAETRRLFYVAATRAKEQLVLVAPTALGKRAAWHEDLLGVFPPGDPAWLEFDPPEATSRPPDLPARPNRVLDALAAWERRTASHVRTVTTFVEPSALARERRAPGEGSGSGALLGRIVHEYLATVALSATATDRALLAALLARELEPVPTEVASDAERLVAGFHVSRLRDRLVAARAVHREHPLAQRRDDGALVLGMLDALVFESDGSVSVLDYKTERVPAGDHALGAERHAAQLLAYANGVRAALHLPTLPRRFVHFLRDDVTIELTLR